MWKRACLLVVAVGCGHGKPRDCDTYAAKVADLSDPAPGQRDGVLKVATDACEKGRVKPEELACVQKASTRDELIACTVGPMSPPPAPKKPTTNVTLTGVRNAGDFKPLDPAHNADQVAWYSGLEKAVAACATDTVYEPKQYVVVVTFSPEPPAISLGGLPEPLAFCIKAALSAKQPDSVKNGPAEFTIDVGK